MLRLGNKSTVHHHLGRIMGGCVRYFGVPAGGTEFDIVGIGGPNASTLIRGVHTTFPSLKMALGCNNTNPMSPLVYMNMILDQLESFKGSCAISSLDKAVYLYPNSILKIHPHNNTIICENGTEYKYKVLALSTGTYIYIYIYIYICLYRTCSEARANRRTHQERPGGLLILAEADICSGV